VIAPVLGVITLLAAPAGFRVEAPLAVEYRFFDEATRALPEAAGAVLFPPAGARPEHLTEAFFWSRRPGWDFHPAASLPALARRGSDRPIYLFLDRVCFMNTACIGDSGNCRAREVEEAQAMVPTPYGRALPHCAAALAAAPWQEIARRPITRPEDRAFDLPSVDPEVTLAILRWDGRAVP
jgi:hypothetical protein